MAGLLLTLTLPPFGWWPLGLAGVATLAFALDGAGWRRRLVVGGCAGLGLYGPGLWWVTEFHALGWVAIVVLEGALLAGALALVPGRSVATGLPAALVVAEAARGRWPFGGLPLAGLDIGQVGGPLLPAARLGGHLLVVAALGVAGVGLWAVLRRRAGLALGCLGSVVLVALAGAVAFDGRGAGPLPVAAVQGGGPRGLRAVDGDPRDVFEAHLTASKGVPPGTALVLWPEDVVDVDRALEGSAQEAALSALARDLGCTLVVGVVEDVPDQPQFKNAAVVWGPDGRRLGRYDKVHRVPFGEYVPFRSFFDRLADLSAVPRDARAGQGPGVLDSPAGRLAVSISYEVFFADRARSGASAGGRLLLVPTNASSYTTAQVPSQELATARLRAVETGRWVVQAAPTGYSAIVDQRGRVHVRSALGSPAVLTSEVRLRTGKTLAVRAGDWLAVLAVVGLGAAWTIKKHES